MQNRQGRGWEGDFIGLFSLNYHTVFNDCTVYGNNKFSRWKRLLKGKRLRDLIFAFDFPRGHGPRFFIEYLREIESKVYRNDITPVNQLSKSKSDE
jgi:hypothetical protein